MLRKPAMAHKMPTKSISDCATAMSLATSTDTLPHSLIPPGIEIGRGGDGRSASEIDPRAENPKLYKPTRLSRPVSVTREIHWPYLSGFVVLHLLALLVFVPWLFSWTGV